MDDRLNQDLLECKNISVVLKSRKSEDPYIESYRLNNLVYSGGRFWGKFSNAHSPHAYTKVGIGPWESLSYAYNNFAPVVCTLSLSSRMERYSSANAYADISFISTGLYRKLWTLGERDLNNVLHEAVIAGLKMKMKIESADGYVYILPVHAIVFFEEKDEFTIETEFDGIPEKLRYFQFAEGMALKFHEFMKKNPNSPYVYTDTNFNGEFFLTYFGIKNNRLTQRKIDGDSMTDVEFKYENVEIWIEC